MFIFSVWLKSALEKWLKGQVRYLSDEIERFRLKFGHMLLVSVVAPHNGCTGTILHKTH